MADELVTIRKSEYDALLATVAAAGDAQRELTEAEAITERNARCTRCGGSLALEVDVRRVRVEQEIDWYTDRPRRGRPSNKLRALRARL